MNYLNVRYKEIIIDIISDIKSSTTTKVGHKSKSI